MLKFFHGCVHGLSWECDKCATSVLISTDKLVSVCMNHAVFTRAWTSKFEIVLLNVCVNLHGNIFMILIHYIRAYSHASNCFSALAKFFTGTLLANVNCIEGTNEMWNLWQLKKGRLTEHIQRNLFFLSLSFLKNKPTKHVHQR